jgi:hypothetical protein
MFEVFLRKYVTDISRLYRLKGSSCLIALSGVKYLCVLYLHNLCCGRSCTAGDSTVCHCSPPVITNAQ